MEELSEIYLDTPQYSWPYLVARRLGAAPEQIWTAAHIGARAENIPFQMMGILDGNGGQAPSWILVHMTGNDVCAGKWANATSAVWFKQGS